MNHAELAELVRVPTTWDQIPGYLDYEALYQRIVADAPPGSLLVEVGSYLGRSVCLLGTLAHEARKGLRVVAVDRCTGSSSDSAGVGLTAALGGSYAGLLARNIAACGLVGVVTLIVADSADAAELVPDGAAWFVFLDADHTRAGLTRDIAAWRSKVKRGGILAGHDYRHDEFEGVAEAVAEAFGPGDHADPDSPSCWSMPL